MIGLVIGGDYMVIRPLDEQGGMASLYLGMTVSTGKGVVVKTVLANLAQSEHGPELLLRFQQEGRVLARVDHPNVVRVLHIGQALNGVNVIVTEFINGKTFRRLMHEGRLTIDRMCEFATLAARGLTEVHEAGVVHRDLKPENIMGGFDASGSLWVKVIDFGIVKDADDKGKTKAGSVLGTPSYMSPEQANGGEVGPQSDTYSLGVILYEMCTGKLPFADENPMTVLYKHVNEPPPPFDPALGIPLAIEKVVLRALSKDPKDRPARTIDLANELSKAARLRTSSATQGAGGFLRTTAPADNRHTTGSLVVVGDTRPFLGRQGLVKVLVLLGGLMLGVGVVRLLRGSPPNPEREAGVAVTPVSPRDASPPPAGEDVTPIIDDVLDAQTATDAAAEASTTPPARRRRPSCEPRDEQFHVGLGCQAHCESGRWVCNE